MSVEAKLVTRVLSDAAVSAIIGDRFHAVILPQDGALPAARFARIDRGRYHAMVQDTSVERHEFQIDAFAKDYAAASNAIEAIRNRLDRWRDAPNGIDDCLLRTTLDDFEGDREVYRFQQDITVFAQQGA